MVNKVVVAVDGSNNSLQPLDYLVALYGTKSDLAVELLYVMPALPPLFDDPAIRRQARKQLEVVEAKNKELAEKILAEARQRLEQKGFAENKIRTHYEVKNQGPARDICHFAGKNHANAIMVGARGRSRLEKFFTGSVSANVLQYSKSCPVWLVNGKVKSNKVLIAVDASENALRAADHMALLLGNTAARITLFHTKRDLSRFLPKDIMEATPDLEKFWQTKTGEQIAPYMQKAVERLTSGGIDKDRIKTKLIHGTRNPAGDILAYARKNGFGTIAMGRHGQSDKKEYSLGSIAGKVLQDSSHLAICIC